MQKVRILSQPDLELRRLQQQNEALKDENETLKDENEVLKNEANRLIRKVAELDFDMDELMVQSLIFNNTLRLDSAHRTVNRRP